MALISLSLFAVFTSIQIFFLLLLLISLQRKRAPGPQHKPPVSVVVCARNEVMNLQKLLPALYSQQYEHFEIIVVNDHSSDETYDYLREENDKVPNLKIVNVEHTPDQFNSKKYALTLGIKAATHDVILLTDADCQPATNQWVATMAANISENTAINLGVSYYEKNPGLLNSFIRFETLWTAIHYIGFALLGFPYMGVGRNLAYRKSLFLKNKGFNKYLGLTGGDDDLFVNNHATKANTTTTTGPEALTISIPKKSWRSFYRQKLRHLSVGKHYRPVSKLLLAIFWLSHIFSWLLLALVTVMGIELYIVGGSFFIRTLLLYLTFISACKKFGVKFDLWGLVFLDVIFVFYYTFTGVVALFTKRVRWS